jgi:hypothetical protein
MMESLALADGPVTSITPAGTFEVGGASPATSPVAFRGFEICPKHEIDAETGTTNSKKHT